MKSSKLFKFIHFLEEFSVVKKYVEKGTRFTLEVISSVVKKIRSELNNTMKSENINIIKIHFG